MLNKPIIYYFISVLFGGFTYLISYNYYLASFIVIILYLFITFLTIDIKFFIITTIFFFIGLVNTYAYYNLNFFNIHNNICNIRIIEDKGYYKYGVCAGKKLVIKNLNDFIELGDVINVKGQFYKDININNRTIGNYIVTEVIDSKKDMYSYFYKIRKVIYSNYYVRIGKEKSATILALTFGDKTYLSKVQKDTIKNLGIIHILTVSGLHIALLYSAIHKVIGRNSSLALTLIYVLLTGAQTSTLRAFFMICILNLSKSVYKKYDNLTALSFSGIIILILKPESISDIGFSLSFLSVLGIFLFYKKINLTMYKLNKFIREPLALTISSQVFSIFINVLVFENISIIGYISNILLVPIYGILLLVTAIITPLIPINYFFTIGCSIINVILITLDGGIFLFQKINFSSITVGYLDGFSLFIIYLSYMLYTKNNKFKYMPLFLIIIYLIKL